MMSLPTKCTSAGQKRQRGASSSGKPQAVKAPQGTFQQMLGGKTAQMLRVRLDTSIPVVPEISANKYVLNIRFLAQSEEGQDMRQRTADWDVGFELTFCNL